MSGAATADDPICTFKIDASESVPDYNPVPGLSETIRATIDAAINAGVHFVVGEEIRRGGIALDFNDASTIVFSAGEGAFELRAKLIDVLQRELDERQDDDDDTIDARYLAHMVAAHHAFHSA